MELTIDANGYVMLRILRDTLPLLDSSERVKLLCAAADSLSGRLRMESDATDDVDLRKGVEGG